MVIHCLNGYEYEEEQSQSNNLLPTTPASCDAALTQLFILRFVFIQKLEHMPKSMQKFCYSPILIFRQRLNSSLCDHEIQQIFALCRTSIAYMNCLGSAYPDRFLDEL